jgi:hypothetical protein
MRRFKNKKLYLVSYGLVGGEQTKVVFTNKLRAYRLAAQIRTSYFVNGEELGKFVEINSVTSEEVSALNLKASK